MLNKQDTLNANVSDDTKFAQVKVDRINLAETNLIPLKIIQICNPDADAV